MKIYISHSSKFNYQEELYVPLGQVFVNTNHTLIYPHFETTNPFPSKQLFISKQCDAILAEISIPSTGQGIELGWADMCDIPLIYLIKKDVKISGSLKLLSSDMMVYDELSSMKENLLTIIDRVK